MHGMEGSLSTLVDLLRRRAEEAPDGPLYTFLSDGEIDPQGVDGHGGETLTRGGLEARARGIAAALAPVAAPGERALLLFPPGLDFIAAFFGCLYAGVVAVPAYPPGSRRHLPRLAAVAGDAAPRVVLTSGENRERFERLAEEVEALHGTTWIATDTADPAVTAAAAADWQPPTITPETLAFLQYTSGSTAAPKGVEVTHGNLMANEAMIHRAFDHSPETVVVGWLPLYHDMGLIGNVLQPLYAGGRCVLMAPMAFLQRPRRWLEAISHFRATTSGGPNFAYDLCVARVPEEERQGLDLTSWKVAYNGAEPVRAETLERFAAAFAPQGFRRAALYPCYGLAEATLFVTGGQPGTLPRVRSVSAAALAVGEALAPVGAEGEETRRLVGCGVPWAVAEGEAVQRILILTPGAAVEEAKMLPDGRVGEICVAGPCVTAGYRQRPEATAETFGGGVLRTGDLGFLADGQLYVTGRIKDLIIIRGRNVYPQDLEWSADIAHPALRPGCGAAFAVEGALGDGGEGVVVVQEIDRRREKDAAGAAEAVRRAVAEAHGVPVKAVVLVRAGQVPKTSSGKVQRALCRRLLETGKLHVLARSGGVDNREALPEIPLGESLRALEGDALQAAMAAYLGDEVAQVAGIPRSAVDPTAPLVALGVDSLGAVELGHRLEGNLEVTLPLGDLLEAPSLTALTTTVIAALEAAPVAAPPVVVPPGTLSDGQRAMWLAFRLNPESVGWNLAAALRLPPPVDPEALAAAVDDLVRRHGVLRAVVAEAASTGDSEPRWQPGPTVPRLHFVDAPESPEALEEALRHRAAEPFDLYQGPLFRVEWWRQGEGGVLFLSVHHIVADLWSLTVVARELGELYRRHRGSATIDPLPQPTATYGDFLGWQQQRLAGAGGEALRHFWRDALEPLPAALELPLDRPRPPLPSHRGGVCQRILEHRITDAVQALAVATGTTPFAVFTAAFQQLLGRLSGQRHFLLGTPAAGRPEARFADTVGYFVNPVVLKAELPGRSAAGATFRDHARAVGVRLRGALAHQDYPFPRLAEELEPRRDPSRPPLFAVSVVWHRPPVGDAGVAALALGVGGEPVLFGGAEAESVALPQPGFPFELSLLLAPLPPLTPRKGSGEARTGAVLQYAEDLFDATTAARWLGHFATLLAAALEAPEAPLGRLSLLTAAERQQIVVGWNDTAVPAHAATPPVHRAIAALAVGEAADRIAVEGPGEASLTYRQLHQRVRALARRLAPWIDGERPVGLCLERSPEQVVALLAALEAGAPYLPLDPDYPQERLAAAAGVAEAAVLCGHGATLAVAREIAAHVAAETGREIPVLDLGAVGPEAESASAVGAPSPVPLERAAYVLFTSGSTGEPNGVVVSHGALANHMAWMQGRFPLTPEDRVLVKTPFGFDASVWEYLAPLLAGARLVLARPGGHREVVYLRRTVEEREITILQLVPSLLRAFLEQPLAGRCTTLRRLFCGGEALDRELAAASRRALPGAAVINLYGPTEATIQATYDVFGEDPEEDSGASGPTVPIGRPISNAVAHVLDADGVEPQPLGVPGELFLGGAGIARGYRGRPALTAARFVPDPFAPVPGARLYRTGDRVVRRGGGALEYLDRLDRQVKIRGQRVEPAEVETALQALTEVRRGAVVVVGEGGAARLAAFAVPAGEGSPGGEALLRALRRRLPEAMVPATLTLLEALPLNPSGKVDRRRLTAMAAMAAEDPAGSTTGGTLPRTATEGELAAIWRQVLGVPEVRIEDDFFALGGHSLLATRVAARVEAAWGIELPLRTFFEAPTLRELALRIGEARRGVPVEPIPVLPRAGDGTAALPLSYAQQRLWFLDQLEPGSAVYNIAYAVEIRGSLEPAVLASVLAAVVARHESLRTTFDAQEGAPVQVIAPPGPVRMPCIDLTALEPLARAVETERLCREEGARPFDLHRGPLLRGVLLRCAPEHHEFLLTLHHIIADGWSMGLMIGEINTLYRDSGSTALPPLPIQFADYAAWQQRTLAGEGFQRDLEYWRGQLAGASTLELPTDRPRPPVETFQGTIQPIRFEEALTAALHGVARQCGGTLYMVLMTAFHALLHQHSGQRDLSVGSPIANRDRVETEDLIGFFANTLVIRADLGGDPTFRELLGQLRTTILEAFAHQDMPFEKLVEALKPARDMSRNPLFQVMLAVQNVMRPEFDLPGMRWFPRDVDNGSSKFDLTFFLWEMDGRLVGKMEHASDLYDRATTRRLLERYQLLLAAVAADPELPLSRLPRMGAAERHQLLVEWNDTASSPSSAAAVDCVHHWVEAQAASTPDAVAVLSGEVVLSYREVEARANRLARGLVRHGVGPEVRVGICTDRTWRTPVAMLAVLKAGGAAVALDPTYPRERLQTILKDSALRVLLTETPFADAFEFPDLTRLYLDREADLFPEEAPTPPPVTVYPDNPMYIIYTSGSTGVPKGITVTHRAFWNLLQWQLGDSPLVQRARTVQFATFGFCVSFQEIFSSFCAGGSLVMVPEGLRRDIEGLWQFLDHQGVERLHLPFAALKQLADVSALRADGDEAGAGSVGNRPVPSKLREVITAGEQLQIGRTVRRLFEHLGPQCTLHNQYGASETHVITSFTLPPFPAGASPDAWPDIAPVGRPVANTRIYLLDETLRPVPLGVPGEVFSSGDPNPRGYLNAPAQSAAKLLPDPFSGEVGARMYRTGDLARHLPDGRIEYMGRIDTQVKIRGFRVELGEVDTVLKLHPGVRDAVTVAQPGAAGTLRLVAYLVGQSAPAAEGGGAGEIDTGEVDAFLRTRLPEHMVPSAYVVLDALPLNANGKLDREALPVPELARPEGAVYVPPSTPTEEVLVALWADLLEVKQVGIRDDFFALGGHSLLATRVMARVRQELGVELPLRELFNHSTVEKLAERIDEATLTGAGAEDLEALLAAMEGANT